MDPKQLYELIDKATLYLKSSVDFTPKALIICGSGLGGIVKILKGDLVEIPYGQIPGFRESTVPGHEGRLVFGRIGSNAVPVMCMVGRLQ